MKTVEIDGVIYHEELDGSGLPLKDQYDQPIEAGVCICHAKEAIECVCGTWWEDEDEG